MKPFQLDKKTWKKAKCSRTPRWAIIQTGSTWGRHLTQKPMSPEEDSGEDSYTWTCNNRASITTTWHYSNSYNTTEVCRPSFRAQRTNNTLGPAKIKETTCLLERLYSTVIIAWVRRTLPNLVQCYSFSRQNVVHWLISLVSTSYVDRSGFNTSWPFVQSLFIFFAINQVEIAEVFFPKVSEILSIKKAPSKEKKEITRLFALQF